MGCTKPGSRYWKQQAVEPPDHAFPESPTKVVFRFLTQAGWDRVGWNSVRGSRPQWSPKPAVSGAEVTATVLLQALRISRMLHKLATPAMAQVRSYCYLKGLRCLRGGACKKLRVQGLQEVRTGSRLPSIQAKQVRNTRPVIPRDEQFHHTSHPAPISHIG